MKSHGQENIKLLKSFYEAASHGDFGPARHALDPDVEWIEPDVKGLWCSGTHRGVDAVWKEVIGPTGEKFENFRVSMKKFYAIGDHVIAIGYFHGRAKTTGKRLDVPTAQVCTLRNGKIVRFEGFHDTDKFLKTLGVENPALQRMAA